MCGISGIEAFLLQSQFHWVGHIVRMPDFRIPKQAFGRLASRCRLQGGPVRRYKDSLKINLRACDLAPSVLRTAPLDRSVWRQCCSNAISAFEKRCTAALVAKRKARKDPAAGRGTMMVCLPIASRTDDVGIRRPRRLCPSFIMHMFIVLIMSGFCPSPPMFKCHLFVICCFSGEMQPLSSLQNVSNC